MYLDKYVSDHPCPQGHAPLRYVSTGECVGCLKSKGIRRYETARRAQYRSDTRCSAEHYPMRYISSDECVECVRLTTYRCRNSHLWNVTDEEELELIVTKLKHRPLLPVLQLLSTLHQDDVQSVWDFVRALIDARNLMA